MGKQAVDLAGQRFGSLIALRIDHKRGNGSSGHKYFWLCKCDCGASAVVYNGHLKNGHTRSCGCLRKEDPDKLINDVFCSYRRGALDRGIVFALSKDDCRDLISRDCFYCGAPPANTRRRKPGGVELAYNGIDRLDANKGYFDGNVVPCCGTCNRVKWILSADDFIKLCKRISIRHI